MCFTEWDPKSILRSSILPSRHDAVLEGGLVYEEWSEARL